MSRRTQAPINFDYDRGSDVLYIWSGVLPAPARTEEEQPGLVWRYDIHDGSVIGLTVIDFSVYWLPRADELAHRIAERLSVPEKEAHAVLDEARAQ